MTETTAQQALRDYLAWLDKSWGDMANGNIQDLRKHGLPVASREGLVLRYGTMFESQPLTTEEKAKVAAARLAVAPRMKECYRVAWQVADLDPDFKYVEGWAQSIIPVEHAWNTLNGKVVDLTWRSNKKGRASTRGQQFNAGLISDRNAYMGIEFPTDYVRSILVREMRYVGAMSTLQDIKRVPEMARVRETA